MRKDTYEYFFYSSNSHFVNLRIVLLSLFPGKFLLLSSRYRDDPIKLILGQVALFDLQKAQRDLPDTSGYILQQHSAMLTLAKYKQKSTRVLCAKEILWRPVFAAYV